MVRIDYGFLTSKESCESIEDVVVDAMTSHDPDSFNLLENLSKLDYDNEIFQQLRKFISSCWDPDDHWKFFDETSEKDGMQKLVDFAFDVADMVKSSAGINYVIRLTDRPEFKDEDEIINKYKTGKMLYTDVDYGRFYGYKERPEPIEPTMDEVYSFLDKYQDCDIDTCGIDFSEDDACFVLKKEHPEDALNELIDFKAEDAYNALEDRLTSALREEFPMWSRDDFSEAVFNSINMQPVYDKFLDQEFLCVVNINGAHNLLGKEMGYTPNDISEAISNGVPDKINSYPSSLAYEYAVVGSEEVEPYHSLVLLMELPLRDLIYKKDQPLHVPAGTRCGLFDEFDGTGGEFKVMIEKDIDLPSSAVNKIFVDHHSSPEDRSLYTVHDVYSSLGDDMWDPIYSAKDLNKLLSQNYVR